MKTNKTSTRTSHDFFVFADSLTAELLTAGRYGTSRTYRKAAGSFRSFITRLRNDSSATIRIEDVDDLIISRYNSYLTTRGLIRNSISFYNRTLRAIYHRAVRQYRLPDRHPFSEVYTGIDRTRNRAVGESTIARLFTLDITEDKSLELARDLFIFSYMTRGMSFVDMAYLRKGDVEGGWAVYRRRKTSTLLKIRIEPEIRKIIDRYASRTRDTPYVFPILTGTEGEETYSQYLSALTTYNRNLKRLSERAGIDVKLSSYISRHSWASIAYSSDVPLSVISESLGHQSERITRIYLRSVEQRRLDEVNRGMIWVIKRNGSVQEPNMARRYT